MSKAVWKRPSMPSESKGALGILSGLLFIGGALAVAGGVSTWLNGEPSGFLTAIVGGSAVTLGFILALANMIVLEIRQASFEAALRAGEVRQVAAKKKPVAATPQPAE